MKKILPLILVACAAACGGSSNGVAQNSAAALPSSSTTRMSAPSNGPSSPRAAPSGGNEGQTASASSITNWGLATYYLAFSVNTGAGSVLDLIQGVAALPPTSCSGSSCIWEGSSTGDPVTWKLTVTEDLTFASPTYSYALAGAAKADSTNTFLTIVAGKAKPSGIPHRGTGNFTVDFDNGKKLNPASADTGRMVITYDNTAVGSATLHVDLTGAVSKDPHDIPAGSTTEPIMNMRYTFAEDGQGGGDLDVGVLNTGNSDVFEVHTKWQAGGAGRAHVSAATPSAHYTELECWNAGAIQITYLEDQPGGIVAGATSACVIADPGAGSNTPPSN